MDWQKIGTDWLAHTWVIDSQVFYRLERTPLSAGEFWTIRKQVAGAANPAGYIVGTSDSLDKAKEIAEEDARLPL